MVDSRFLKKQVRESQQGKSNPLEYVDTVGDRTFHFQAIPSDDGSHVYRTTMLIQERGIVFPSPDAFRTYRASMLSSIAGELNRADNKD